MRLRKGELANLLGCSEPTASKLITKMNKELEDQGYLTIRGSIPREYAFKRLLISSGKQEEIINANIKSN